MPKEIFFFVEPFDICIFRDNQLFGQLESNNSATLMPPWPSVFAGAFRSEMLAIAEQASPGTIERFTKNEKLPGPIGDELGTPKDPGSFKLTWLSLAKLNPPSTGKALPILPLPRDVQVGEEQGVKDDIETKGYYQTPFEDVSSFGVYVSKAKGNNIVIGDPNKPRSKGGEDFWFKQEGLNQYLQGKDLKQFYHSTDLFQKQSRVGIGISPATRTTQEGKLFTSEAVKLNDNYGFLVGITGTDSLWSKKAGTIRLGGDGRGAQYRQVETDLDSYDQEKALISKKIKLVLLTPTFPGKTNYLGFSYNKDSNSFVLKTGSDLDSNACPRLVAVSTGNAQTISGWDLARWAPKPAEKTMEPGSVFWFDNVSPAGLESLEDWVENSLGLSDPQRQAQGFNRAYLANWND